MIGANTQPQNNSPDSLLTVRFYMRTEPNNFETEKQGVPIFFSEPYVEIMVPGNQHTIIETPVRAEHKRRFPQQWAIFEASQKTADEMQIIGTPLEQWPAISRQQAEELKGKRFYTVQQIANCTEQQAQGMGMLASSLRQKAQAFLAAAQDSALAMHQGAEIERLRAEQAEKDRKHAEEIRKQAEEMAELRAMVEAQAGKRGPGRPKKEQVEA